MHTHTRVHVLTCNDDLEGETRKLLVVAASEDKGEGDGRSAFHEMLLVLFNFTYFVYFLSSAGTTLHASNPQGGQSAPLSGVPGIEPLGSASIPETNRQRPALNVAAASSLLARRPVRSCPLPSHTTVSAGGQSRCQRSDHVSSLLGILHSLAGDGANTKSCLGSTRPS